MKSAYYNNVNTDFSKEDLYDEILNSILSEDQNSIEKILEFTKNINISLDLSYQDGLLVVLAAQKGNTDILKTLCNYDKKIISNYGIEMLSHAANYGRTDVVKFLLEYKSINPLKIQDTTAYSNNKEIEYIFNGVINGDTDEGKKNDTECIGENLHQDTITNI